MKTRAVDLITQQRNSAVTTPSALIATQCDMAMYPMSTIRRQVDDLMKRNDLTDADKAVIELCILAGSRISAVLKLNSRNVRNDGKITIIQDKKSLNISYQPSYSLDFWLYVKKYGLSPFDGLSRFYYYRLFVKLGLVMKFGDNKRFSATHIGRHYQALINLNSSDFDFKDNNILGHRNLKNLEYYEKLPAKNQKR